MDDPTHKLRRTEEKATESIEAAIDSVHRTIATSDILVEVPGREGSAQERIIAAEQELALLEAEREVFESGENRTDEGHAFIDEATATLRELAEEDRARHEAHHAADRPAPEG